MDWEPLIPALVVGVTAIVGAIGAAWRHASGRASPEEESAYAQQLIRELRRQLARCERECERLRTRLNRSDHQA
jgi:hypothetical protein